MDKVLEHFPEVIKAAAGSLLGVLALIILLLGVLACFFFKGSSERTRVVVFSMLFGLGLLVFAGAMFHQAPVVAAKMDTKPDDDDPHRNGDTDGPRSPTYPIQLSAGAEARAKDVVYKVLGAELDRSSDTELALRLKVRLTNNGTESVMFSDSHFRLVADDMPLSPSAVSITEFVARDSAKEGVVTFIFPQTAKALALRVGHPGATATIPLSLTPSPAR